jgi:hypothetical protein
MTTSHQESHSAAFDPIVHNQPSHSSSKRGPYEDILLLIGRMDGKLDTLLATNADHGRRISELEHWRHRLDDLPHAVSGLKTQVSMLDAWKNRWLGWTLASALLGGTAANADRILNLFLR